MLADTPAQPCRTNSITMRMNCSCPWPALLACVLARTHAPYTPEKDHSDTCPLHPCRSITLMGLGATSTSQRASCSPYHS